MTPGKPGNQSLPIGQRTNCPIPALTSRIGQGPCKQTALTKQTPFLHQPTLISGRTGSKKEVFQPHLPVRLPCYDLALVTRFTLARLSRRPSGPPNSHGLTGGVYKVRERIHRAMADARLLAIPASWGRVADPNPNCDRLYKIGI